VRSPYIPGMIAGGGDGVKKASACAHGTFLA
jgi:hypothetical protein